VLVRGSQGRGSAGFTETDCAVTENGDDELQDKKSDARSYDRQETSETCLAVNLLQVRVNRHSRAWWVNHQDVFYISTFSHFLARHRDLS
jgi:hypothetical protein